MNYEIKRITVNCKDGKTRWVSKYDNGRVIYGMIKNEKEWGTFYHLNLKKLPKWATVEILEQLDLIIH